MTAPIAVEELTLCCPGCRRPIVDLSFTPNDDGGKLVIEHALPFCAWWATPAARQWAIRIASEAITHADAPTEPS